MGTDFAALRSFFFMPRVRIVVTYVHTYATLSVAITTGVTVMVQVMQHVLLHFQHCSKYRTYPQPACTTSTCDRFPSV
jgi:hypothetical protein